MSLRSAPHRAERAAGRRSGVTQHFVACERCSTGELRPRFAVALDDRISRGAANGRRRNPPGVGGEMTQHDCAVGEYSDCGSGGRTNDYYDGGDIVGK